MLHLLEKAIEAEWRGHGDIYMVARPQGRLSSGRLFWLGRHSRSARIFIRFMASLVVRRLIPLTLVVGRPLAPLFARPIARLRVLWLYSLVILIVVRLVVAGLLTGHLLVRLFVACCFRCAFLFGAHLA